MWAVVATATLLLLPFAWPADFTLARVLTTGLAISLSMRLGELRAGRVHASLRGRGLRLLVWLLVPTVTQVPEASSERRALRRLGGRRLGRAALKGGLLIAIVLGKPALADHFVATTLLVAFQVYFMISGLADVVTGLLAVAGIAAADAFVAPFAATSPAEFWGRRWNLFVNQFLSRHLFRPWARRGRPGVGILAAFVASGIGHEYFALAVVGFAAYQPGYMFVFFALHGVAVFAQALWARARGRRARRLPRPLGWALHMAFIVVTVPLFVRPLAPVIQAFDRAVRGWLG